MILRYAAEGTKVTMVHRDGSTREVETRGLLHYVLTIWWPLCGPYPIDLRTGVLSSSYIEIDDGALTLWRLAAADLEALRKTCDPEYPWEKIEPWPPAR